MAEKRFCGTILTTHGSLDMTGRPLLMGVLNVTPDSFSDAGEFASPEAAAQRARQMVQEGADLIDVGGESTRPGSQPVPPDQQIQRVVLAIEAIRTANVSLPISVDTRLAPVARAALDAGADLVNDISALRDDAAMGPLVAGRNVPVVLMHMLGRPATMQERPVYHDVVAQVASFLQQRIEAAISLGIARDRIIVDPGVGFGKTAQHNLAVLQDLARFLALGQPLLVGPSRKRFIGQVLGLAEPKERLWGTAAAVAAAALAGAHILRVHDVAAMRQVATMSWSIRQGTWPQSNA